MVFRRMKTKNIVSWTAMLVGYGQNGCSEEAVRTYCEMQKHGIEPDDFTLGSVISSCANLASLEEGTQLHCRAIVSGLISFITVSNALVTLYEPYLGTYQSVRRPKAPARHGAGRQRRSPVQSQGIGWSEESQRKPMSWGESEEVWRSRAQEKARGSGGIGGGS
ncbi:pentatricopeptide repeat-containing protein [Canna indica]|uniref:Pentatricopeptide repeat-containing protein n=1 Tax=Canna indica TaxID=4628 RepID=A0AAQ3KTT5_9LILI|nr:pentatricopeptide repeat-containing protein [Canna indica]